MGRFDRNTTAAEITAGLDLHGRTIVITGGAGGLGLQAVRALTAAGADVTVAELNTHSARKILNDAELREVAVEPLDLADLASVTDFTDRWGARRLDVLINCAGIMYVPEGRTVDGFELHMGINHLGHFLLANRLLPALVKGHHPRVVAVSSSAHRLAPWDEEDPHYRTHPFDTHQAYGRSKAANAMFALGFDRRFKDQGVRAFALMPGVVVTGLMGHMTDEDAAALQQRMEHVIKQPDTGAATIAYAAVSPELDGTGGLYLEDCAVAPPAVPERPGFGVADHVLDEQRQDRLWAWSCAEVGLKHQ